MPRRVQAIAVAAALAAAPALLAQEPGNRVMVHGFGSWSYGTTDGNDYLFGRRKGDYRNSHFDVNLGAILSDHLRVDAQVGWDQAGAETGSDTDFAFAEWWFSDAARLRIGQVKQPFGIYTEVFHVGTVRPFLVLPQSVYGSIGVVGTAYKGIGLTGSRTGASGWAVQYDLYGGGLDVEEDETGLDLLRDGPPVAGEPLQDKGKSSRNLLGGRLTVETPVHGLTFGVSSYTATILRAGDPRLTVGGVHGEYLTESWSARAEYVHLDESRLQKLDAGYAEIAYSFSPHWQGAFEYDRVNTSLPGVDVSLAPTLLEHRQWSAGVNYWFTPNLVIKLSYHHVSGNRLALPGPTELPGAVQTGRLDPRTRAVFFGSAMSF